MNNPIKKIEVKQGYSAPKIIGAILILILLLSIVYSYHLKEKQRSIVVYQLKDTKQIEHDKDSVQVLINYNIEPKRTR